MLSQSYTYKTNTRNVETIPCFHSTQIWGAHSLDTTTCQIVLCKCCYDWSISNGILSVSNPIRNRIQQKLASGASHWTACTLLVNDLYASTKLLYVLHFFASAFIDLAMCWNHKYLDSELIRTGKRLNLFVCVCFRVSHWENILCSFNYVYIICCLDT